MSYIIVFWDKSKIQVNDIIGEKLKLAVKAGQLKNFELGDSLYAISGIEKIIPKDEAYIVFPADTEYLSDMNDRPPTKETMLALEESNKNPAKMKGIGQKI